MDAWFAARGYRVEVHEVDPDALERTTAGNEPDRYTLSLIGMRGQLHRPGYASGYLLEDVQRRARARYHRELSEPGEELRWSQPALTMRAGDGSWEPIVELHNLSDTPVTVIGFPKASGRLLRADGTRADSGRMHMHAMAVPRNLPPSGLTTIAVLLALTPDERAALPPGSYRLVDVSFGELKAPDIDVEICADH